MACSKASTNWLSTTLLCAAVLLASSASPEAAAGDRDQSQVSQRGVDRDERMATIRRERNGGLTYELPDGAEISCRADRGEVSDCVSTTSRGPATERSRVLWFIRSTKGRSFTITAVGRSMDQRTIPGGRLSELVQGIDIWTRMQNRQEELRKRREKLLAEAMSSTAAEVTCEMCIWGALVGSCRASWAPRRTDLAS